MLRSVQWTPGTTLDQMELQVIEVAYAHYQGNKTQTAISLGISVRNLDMKLEEIKDARDLETANAKERDERDQDFLRRARGLPPIVREQSTPQIAPKQPVPVRELEEIQEVLPSKTSAGQRRASR